MSEKFDAEKFTHTLNTLGIWESMLNQIADQQIYGTLNCVYYRHFSNKLLDLIISLKATNAHYAHMYEKFKEENELNG